MMKNIPEIGYGTYTIGNDDVVDMVKDALKCGYRHIDTAQLYKNEIGVGKGIREAMVEFGIKRESIFVTTKIHLRDIKSNNIVKSIQKSLKVLNIGYIDLILLHAPLKISNDNIDRWKTLCDFQTKNTNFIKFVGVSNYNIKQLETICKIQTPFCNQIEVSPFLTRKKLCDYCKKNDIRVVAHSSLTKGLKLDDKDLVLCSQSLGITSAQTLLVWALQRGYYVIPRTLNIKHLYENYNTLSIIAELHAIDLDCLKQFTTHPQWIK